jgi:hypothetical protein
MTSSPGPMPYALSASSMPIVPLETAMAYFLPV